MSFLTSFQDRYTTKVYDNTQSLNEEQIEALKQILRLSPSSINGQPWQFTFVRDETVKKQLSQVSWLNTERVLHCDTVVVFSAESSKEVFETRIQKDLPEGAFNYYKEFLKPLTEHELKAWFAKQVYLALGVFLSACATMGIDATPMEGIEPEQYDLILKPRDYTTIVAVCIGKRDKEDFNQPSKKAKVRRPLKDVIKVV